MAEPLSSVNKAADQVIGYVPERPEPGESLLDYFKRSSRGRAAAGLDAVANDPQVLDTLSSPLGAADD